MSNFWIRPHAVLAFLKFHKACMQLKVVKIKEGYTSPLTQFTEKYRIVLTDVLPEGNKWPWTQLVTAPWGCICMPFPQNLEFWLLVAHAALSETVYVLVCLADMFEPVAETGAVEMLLSDWICSWCINTWQSSITELLTSDHPKPSCGRGRNISRAPCRETNNWRRRMEGWSYSSYNKIKKC